MNRSAQLAAILLVIPATAVAQEEPTDVAGIVVISPTPVGGAGIPLEQVPAAADIVRAGDLSRTGAASLLRGLDENVGQVSISGAQANPFQPSVFYRGFEASPLVGAAQGLAVYIDGGRFNQPFGDTADWDLIPDGAIQSITVAGANPIFGLNALGGSLDVRMKTGEDAEGFAAEISGGSFGRRDAFLEWGGVLGGTSIYVAGRGLDDDGWRDFSPSKLRQAYADFGWSSEDLQLNLKLLGADNDLTGNGPAPVELLAVDRDNVFTHPDRTQNEFGRVSLTADFQATERLSMQGVLYLQQLRQRTMNGDAAEVEPCEDEDEEGLLCLEDDDDEEVLTDAAGDPIPDFLDGGLYGFLNSSATRSRGHGASFQVSLQSAMGGRPNRFIAGLSYDGGSTRFGAQSAVGALDETRGFVGEGIVVEQEDGAVGSVAVKTTNRYLGAYFSNILEISPAVTLTISGRYNAADVQLRDQIGTALNGDHEFSRFNPAIGLTWQASDTLSFYGGYSEANRAPTPAELSCADPEAPCSLTNFFLSDPPLEQVVAETFEAGARGRFGDKLRWTAGLYRTENRDDIMFTASEILGRAYFQNVGETRRQGGHLDLTYAGAFGRLGLAYAYTDATFQSPLTLNSENNPLADEDGRIHVQPGDQMPGVPKHKVKMTFDHDLTDAWRIGASAIYSGEFYLHGDEANLTPQADSYTVVNLSTAYRFSPRIEVFGAVENLLDEEYETFGTFSPVDEVPIPEVPDISNPRSLSPGAPRAVYVGLRLKL